MRHVRGPPDAIPSRNTRSRRRRVAAIDVSHGVDVDSGRVLGGMTWGLLAGLGAGWLVTEIGCRLPESSELR